MPNAATWKDLASYLALTVLFAGCGGGDGGTEPETPRATTITVSPSSVTMTFLGQTLSLTASVGDQNGQPFNTTVTWSTADAGVATVSTAGVVTAVGNGTTTVHAGAGTASGSVSISVQQVASQVTLVSGDGQAATVGATLLEGLVAQSNDAGGSPVPSIDIAFEVAAGGGALSVTAVTTDAQGRASSAWTLGTEAGTQRVDVAIVGTTSGGAAFTATAAAGPPAAVSKVSGDEQSATKGTALADPVVVRVADEFDNGVSGVTVSFAVNGGGGLVDTGLAETGSDGTAQAVWTMGPAAGAGALTATVQGFAPVGFSATSLGVPDLIVSALTATPNTPTLQQTVTVRVTVSNAGDGPSNLDVTVQVEVDGTVVGSLDVDALAPAGEADGEFTLGPLAEGAHTITVRVDPGGAITESDESNNSSDIQVTAVDAVALEVGTPVTGLAGATDSQTFFTIEVPAATPAPGWGPVATSIEGGARPQKTGFAPGAIRMVEGSRGASSPARAAAVTRLAVTLSGGTGDADLYVHFGSRPNELADYDCFSLEVATTESCVFNNPAPGTYHILVQGFADYSGVTLLGTTAEGGPFNIELVFINHGTPSQDEAIAAAAVRWMGIVRSELPDVDFSANPVAADACIAGQPLVNDVVDDLRIFVDLIPIDGPFGILAQAGWCLRRGSGLPIIGVMQFDVADLDLLAVTGNMGTLVIHEMGHVLGIGTLWDEFGLLQNPSLPSSQGADTHFTGSLAIAAFDAAGGVTYTGGAKVPVENMAGVGSGDGHWRETPLDDELMTPFLNSGQPNPLSTISIQSLADLGYTVDVAQADSYSKAFAAPGRAPSVGGRMIWLQNDIYNGPLMVIDNNGRVIRVIRR